MTAIALIFTLSAIGISETVYLIRKREAHQSPVCPIGEGCEVVLTSKYSKTFFISNDVLGLMAYIAISIISAFVVLEIKEVLPWKELLNILVLVASLASIYFVYLQWKVIKAWCFWCLMSAFTIWLMGFILLVSNNI